MSFTKCKPSLIKIQDTLLSTLGSLLTHPTSSKHIASTRWRHNTKWAWAYWTAQYNLRSVTLAPPRVLSSRKTHLFNWACIPQGIPPPKQRYHSQQIAAQRSCNLPGSQHCPFTGWKLTPQHQQICRRGLHHHLRREWGKFLRHKNHQNLNWGGYHRPKDSKWSRGIVLRVH